MTPKGLILCVHCQRLRKNHPQDKCPYQPTNFAAVLSDTNFGTTDACWACMVRAGIDDA